MYGSSIDGYFKSRKGIFLGRRKRGLGQIFDCETWGRPIPNRLLKMTREIGRIGRAIVKKAF